MTTLADTSATRDRMRELFARVAKNCDLPPLPAVAMRALTLVRDPDTTAQDLAQVVSSDGPIAARVLRIARSAMYVRRTPPATIQDAITSVGFEALKKILLVASARSAYAVNDDVAERLWSHALATALAADELAVLAGERRGGASFVAGLLHDMGRLVFHLSDKTGFAALGDCDEAREVEHFGVSHAAVAGCLAEQWGLEDAVVEGLTFHHRAEMSPLAARLVTADRLAQQIGYGTVIDAGFEDDAPDATEDPAARLELVGRIGEVFDRERPFFM